MSTIQTGQQGIVLDRPNALGVGFGKAGTSFIAQVLGRHPNICFPSLKGAYRKVGTKIYYESEDPTEEGLLAYVREQYPGYQPSQHSVMMEWRTGHIYSEHELRAIGNLLGHDIRILVAFRNPVDVFFSLYNYMITLNPDNEEVRKPLEYFLETDFKQYVSDFFYDEHFERLRDVLPRAKVILLRYETLKRRPNRIFDSLFEFLSVPPDSTYLDHPPVNVSKPYRSIFVDKCVRKVLTILGGRERATRIYHSPDSAKPAFLRMVLALNSRENWFDRKIERKLHEIHAPHMEKFERLIEKEHVI